MVARVLAIALNTYREAVRAKLLLSMLGLALATSAYSVILGTLSLHHEARVVADVGAASTSFYAVVTAIVMGATSLYREIELKTIFPMLARPLRRYEYLLGKYLGTMGTLSAFVLIDLGLVLALLAVEAGASPLVVGGAAFGMLVVLGLLLWRARRWRVYVALPWCVALVAVMTPLAAPAGPDRQLVLLSAVLTLSEAAIIAAVALLFSSFSSPFLTAVFTLGIFLTGRSSDTLAHMPDKVFGKALHDIGVAWTRVFPNLQMYVPPRALLVGDVSTISLRGFMVESVAHAVVYTAGLLIAAAVIFQRRDFQ
jgi:ABC-type transport system involved in multi-copper enzyme maturation permease subunit